jgi:hypothetical protein
MGSRKVSSRSSRVLNYITCFLSYYGYQAEIIFLNLSHHPFYIIGLPSHFFPPSLLPIFDGTSVFFASFLNLSC